MVLRITHAKVSSKLDGADSNLIQPSDWNANLVSTMTTGKLLGRYSANTGPVQEITIGSGLLVSNGTITAVDTPTHVAVANGTVIPISSQIFMTSDGSGNTQTVYLDDSALDEFSFGVSCTLVYETRPNGADAIKFMSADVAITMANEGAFVELVWDTYYYGWVVQSSSGVIPGDGATPKVKYRDNHGAVYWSTARDVYRAGIGYQDVDTGTSLVYQGYNQLRLTTIGSSGTKTVAITNGTLTGERVSFYLFSKTNVGDSVSFTVTNLLDASGVQPTSVILDTTTEQVMFEWQINKWKVICASSGVVT